mmetsp:Transcript_13420/g.34104  ORF Transcript_13420/g.34104 Transcript_13420/m.34104 type:complete len:153 (-) Transcript_13420:970-1428(-)
MRLLTPLRIAEFDSTSYTAVDYVRWLLRLLACLRTRFPDFTPPLMVITDCSAQLEAAALAAFSSAVEKSKKDMKRSRIAYGNVTLFHALWYEGATAEGGDDISLAKEEIDAGSRFCFPQGVKAACLQGSCRLAWNAHGKARRKERTTHGESV